MFSSSYWIINCFQNSSTPSNNHGTSSWNDFSIVLRIFLPLAGLALFWGRKDIVARIFLHIDRKCVAVFCPSLSRRDKLLKWASGRLPYSWSSHSKTLSGGIEEFWSDGSLLCTLINTAIPGACPNPHRHWKKPPLHAQAVAFKYLGVTPSFTENDLSATLTINHERNFITYLYEIQNAMNKLPTRNESDSIFSSHYVVRGMGLFTGEQYKKTIFYIYSNMKSGKGSNIEINIRGPYGTFGKAIVDFPKPTIQITNTLNKTKTEINNNRKSFLKSLTNFQPFTASDQKEETHDIKIKIAFEKDRIRVAYIPENYGIYEVNFIAGGELIKGCPYYIHVTNNTKDVRETFDDEIVINKKVLKKKIIRKCVEEDPNLISQFMQPCITITESSESDKTDHTLLDIKIQENITSVERRFKTNENNSAESLGLKAKVTFQELPLEEDKILETEEEEENNNNNNINQNYNNLNQNDVKNELDNVKVSNDNLDNTKYYKNYINNTTQSLTVLNNNTNIEKNKKIENIVKYFNNNKDSPKLPENTPKILNINVDTNENNNSNPLVLPVTSPICPNHIAPEVENKVAVDYNNTFLEEISTKVATVDRRFFLNTSPLCLNHIVPEVKDSKIATIDSKILTSSIYFPDIDPEVVNNKHNSNFLNTSPIYSSHIVPEVVDSNYNNTPKTTPISTHIIPEVVNAKDCSNALNTSPISSTNIIPEVVNNKNSINTLTYTPQTVPKVLSSLKQKRKFFQKQSYISRSSNSSNSFSETEYDAILNDNSIETDYNSRTESNESENNYSLSSTISLPNLNSEIDHQRFSYKEKKSFWERMSSSSTSLNSTYPKENVKYKSEGKFASISIESINENSDEEIVESEKNSFLRRSTDDILSNNKEPLFCQLKAYKSIDNCLDYCTIFSIEERKRILLKEEYKKEQENSLKRKSISQMKICDPLVQKKQINLNYFSSPVPEKQYEKTNTVVSNEIESRNNNNFIYNNLEYTDKNMSKANEEVAVYRFKKAINYFKDLESSIKKKFIQ